MSSISRIDLTLEESTIDPKSFLPSFLEVMLLERASESGQKVLKTSIEAIAANSTQYLQRRNDNNHGTRIGSILYFRKYIALIVSRLCTKYKLEVQLILTYFIEKNVLSTPANAALSESLFGLKRTKIKKGHSLRQMKKSDAIKAALVLAILPYISQKAKTIYEMQLERARDAYQTNHNSTRQDTKHDIFEKFKSMYMYIFPFLHMSVEGINVAYAFAYMLGKSVYSNPSLHILGQVVGRYTMKDLKEMVEKEDDKNSQIMVAPSDLSRFIKKSASMGILIALLMGWMGQFRRELRRRRRQIFTQGSNIFNSTARNIGENAAEDGNFMTIPPPFPPSIKRDGTQIDPTLCPLCEEERINPVASTSGYVYCYKCIIMSIRNNGKKCPITGMPCTESQLVRIYESTNVANQT